MEERWLRSRFNAFREFGLRLTAVVPEGQTTIAPRFNAGFTSPPIRVPKGRLKCEWEWRFNRPFGTFTAANVFPALKSRANLTVSLRDSRGQTLSEFPKALGLGVMPFGNSWSEAGELHGAFPRLVAAQPWPAADRLAHRPRTTPGTLALPRHQPPGPLHKSLRQLFLLARA